MLLAGTEVDEERNGGRYKQQPIVLKHQALGDTLGHIHVFTHWHRAHASAHHHHTDPQWHFTGRAHLQSGPGSPSRETVSTDSLQGSSLNLLRLTNFSSGVISILRASFKSSRHQGGPAREAVTSSLFQDNIHEEVRVKEPI